MPILFISVFVLSAARAEEIKEPKEGIENPHKLLPSWSTLGQDLISPVTTSARIPLITGAGLSIFFRLTKSQIEDPIDNSLQNKNLLGDYSQIGDYSGRWIPNAAYFVGMLTYGLIADDARAKIRARMMLEATTFTSTVAVVLKQFVRQRRPGSLSNFKSFPSGHTSTAFAFASLVAAEHEWYWGVSAYALAGFVGFSRMNDRCHFLHDVLAGAAIGTSYGLGISLRQKEREAEYDKANPSLSSITIAPVPSPDLLGGGIAATASF